MGKVSSPDVNILDLRPEDTDKIEQIAQFLFACFRKYSPTWLPDMAACHEEIKESFASNRRSRVLMDAEDRAVGWIGAITDDHLWEIHPIAVKPEAQRAGYGLRLVEDVCTLASDSGAVAIWAGTSDETHSTSFSKIDLYGDTTRAFSAFEAPDDHPLRFWSKTGFSIVGVQPDEEGLGKPGIHFAKRLVSP
ncbi:MAG: GNAT family N-acetyltransferase [Pseudomonadota bacterium]